MGEFAIGQGVSRFEDPRLIQGGGRYIDDIKLPGMAHGVVLRSPHAHAKIKSIDISAAKAAPGVLAVLTAADVKAAGFGDLPVPGGLKRRDGSPQYKPRYPILAEDRVRWVGDCVAFVVAETVAQAIDAAELIEVDYEPLPSVTSTAEAPKPGAPRVWEDCPDNICFVELIGDKAATDAAFARAAHVVKHRFVINRVTAATMEPRGAVGDYNAADGRYTIYTPMQRPHPTRADLAKVLKVPESKVRIITGDIGGSFGMKSPIFNETPLVLLGVQAHRPAGEMDQHAHGSFPERRAGARQRHRGRTRARQGRHTSSRLRVKTIAAIGAYLQHAMPAFVLNAGTLAGVYRTPAIHVDITAVFTNTNPVRPYRGNGRPEAAYVIERMVDLAAAELKMDPAELRRRNYIPPSAMPFKTGLTFTYDSGEFEKNMDLALELADRKGFKSAQGAARKRGKLLGFGLSNTIERAAAAEHGRRRGALRPLRHGDHILRLEHAGPRATRPCSSNWSATGSASIPNDVHYVQGDTDQVFYGEGTGGSRSATMAGSAFHLATEKVIAKARAIAAHMLKVDESDLKFDEGVFSTNKTNRTLSIKEIAAPRFDPAKLPKGMEPGLFATAVYNAPVNNYPNGCHICELEIDQETGKVEIVRYSVVDDVGTVLNPLLLHGQIHGGIAQGAGQALMEDIHFDARRPARHRSFMDYAMPHAHDFCDMEVESNPVPTKTNPLGVKGAGEAGCVGALPAVANALVDALSEFGVKHIEMPATPERIWRAIRG